MRIVNFFGGPGVGKSTVAAGLYYEMKTRGISAELVTEYAKDVTWEGRTTLFEDQLYLLAKQNRKLERLIAHPLEYAVTDSPILLCAAYARLNGMKSEHYIPLVREVFAKYDNFNVIIQRDPTVYQQVGRKQTLEQAATIDTIVMECLREFEIPHVVVQLDSKMTPRMWLDTLKEKGL